MEVTQALPLLSKTLRQRSVVLWWLFLLRRWKISEPDTRIITEFTLVSVFHPTSMVKLTESFAAMFFNA